MLSHFGVVQDVANRLVFYLNHKLADYLCWVVFGHSVTGVSIAILLFGRLTKRHFKKNYKDQIKPQAILDSGHFAALTIKPGR